TTSHLEFHRMWLLSVFARTTEWDNDDAFVSLLHAWGDTFTQRELILAIGRSRQDSWLRQQKRNLANFGPWPKRALLYAGSALPADERRHWYQTLEPSLDPLELAVVRWA